MQKPTSVVSFLLTITACVLFVLGIVCAIRMYNVDAEILKMVPGVKVDHSASFWTAGSVFLVFYVPSLILLALAQIVDSTAASAVFAEQQTEYLKEIADRESR